MQRKGILQLSGTCGSHGDAYPCGRLQPHCGGCVSMQPQTWPALQVALQTKGPLSRAAASESANLASKMKPESGIVKRPPSMKVRGLTLSEQAWKSARPRRAEAAADKN